MKMNQDLKGSQQGMRERPEPDLEDAACVGRAVPESHGMSVEKGRREGEDGWASLGRSAGAETQRRPGKAPGIIPQH